MSSSFRRSLAVIGLLCGVLGCEPLYQDLDYERAQAPIFRADQITDPPTLGSPAQLPVMAWNVKYGAARLPFWFDCWGDRVEMTSDEVDANLDGLTALIREVDPAVLMTEEIEVGSRRSAYTDMVARILRDTELNYAAYFSSWDSRYIPSEGLGRMDLGVAIFSKYPIVAAEAIRQADRTDQDAATKAFYFHRVVGRAELQLEDGNVAAYAVHTEAYDLDGTKQNQIRQIADLMEGESLPFILGGDFNELPPTAVRTEEFADERATAVCSAEFEQPPYTPEIMQEFYDDLVPWIDLTRYGAAEDEQRRYYTHTVLGPDEVNESGEAGFWTRTLDYLFGSAGSAWVDGTTDVLQSAGQEIGSTGTTLVSDPMELSDHAPVVGVWEVSP